MDVITIVMIIIIIYCNYVFIYLQIIIIIVIVIFINTSMIINYYIFSKEILLDILTILNDNYTLTNWMMSLILNR